MDTSMKINPQKKNVKNICQILYYLGLGDYWYEKTRRSTLHQKIYQIWRGISLFYTFSFIANEFLAHIRTDLNDKEKNDLIQFTLAHTIISVKVIYTLLKRDRIVVILERLLEGSRSFFVSEDLDEACKRQSVRVSVALLVSSYMTMLASTVDGVRVHLIEGIPIRTEVTFYPTSLNTGLPVNILRFFVQFHWWFVVTIMLSIDSICVCCLYTAGHKFKLLQVYFASMREKLLVNQEKKSRIALEEEFTKDFVIGIKMHEDALWCARNVQFALGFLCSVQVFEGVVLIVMCLIKLVTVERHMIFLMANLAYIICCIQLTGAYMLPAGDITHEASMISTAVFHSGWELVNSRRLRALVVLTLQRSQVPVYLSAFGLITLSYGSFITVIRSSYSFFAVMY